MGNLALRIYERGADMNISLQAFQKNLTSILRLKESKLGLRKPTETEKTKQELLHKLNETNREMEEAMAQFNDATDHCLIDMYAYEIKSLEQKYSFYLARMRQIDPSGVTGHM